MVTGSELMGVRNVHHKRPKTILPTRLPDASQKRTIIYDVPFHRASREHD